MIKNKTIALIAHDRRKTDLLDWVKYNAFSLLHKNRLVTTGTTGKLVQKELENFIEDIKSKITTSEKLPVLDMDIKASGPLGGDAEIAAMVVNKEIDFCVFFIDDLNPNPHEADIQMLLRQCRLHNIPVACNRSSADFMISSNLWDRDYESTEPTYIEFKRE